MSGFQFVSISVANLSPFRFSIDGHASKVLQAASLVRQLEDTANMESMFGQGDVFLGVQAVLSTGAILEAVPTVYCRGKQCLQEQCFGDKSKVLSTGAMLWR